METKFNFNSQVCTSRVQSERLLSLGLKKETADMIHQPIGTTPFNVWDKQEIEDDFYPAWSLGRLIEMMPNEIRKYDAWANLSINNELVQYAYYDIDYNHGTCLEYFNDGTLFDNICDAYEWLIKEGYFNKEYLENGK